MNFKYIISGFLFYSTLIMNGHAQVWNVAGGGNWAEGINWTLGAVPAIPTDNVIFDSSVSPTGPITVAIPGTFSIEDITLTAPGYNCTLSGGALSLSPLAGNGIAVTGTDQHTINTNLNYLTAFTVDQGSSHPLTLSGIISGSLAFSKTGAGDLILSGTNSNIFTGLLTINEGKVIFNKSAGLLACGGGVTLSGATAELQLDASEQTSPLAPIIISDATAVLDLNGQTTTVASLNITTTGTYDLGGTLNLAGTAANTLQSPAGTSPTITGMINLVGFTGGVYKTAAGTLTLQNLGIQNGTHDVGGTGAIEINGIISGSGNFNKTGSSILTLTGTDVNTYAGLTTITAGTMNLNRTVPGSCIPGDVVIAGGSLVLQQSHQIVDTANLTLNGGSFNMGGFGETLNSFTMNAGTILNNTGSGLSLQSTATALTMRNTTIQGQIYLTGSFGGTVLFNPLGGGTATLTHVDLGTAIRTFDVGDGAAGNDMLINGVISGSGGIHKRGAGTLTFASTSSNTYSGLTTVSSGTLLLSKTAPFIAIAGDLLIDGGTVQSTIANQISDTSNVQINSGTFNINNLAETIKSFTFNGGMFSQGTGQLSLNSTSTALTMRNTNILGRINLTGSSGGDVVFDSSKNGIALINFINLGSVDRIFDIAAGSSDSVKMVLQGSSGTGGGLIKEGEGILELIGAHDYPLSTVQVLNGTLVVNGVLTCPGITIHPNGILKGAGTISGAATYLGRLKLANSIGTLNLIGDQTFGSTFILENEFNQSATDLMNITGSLTINPGASITLVPLVDTFTLPLTHTIIQTTTGITGTFTTLNNPLIFYSANILYNPNSIILELTPEDYSSFGFSGNAGSVANYLDEISISLGSDLAAVDTAIRQLTTEEEVKQALLQLQPSQLKGLALSQENNAFQIESVILQRSRKTCNGCSDRRTNLWSAINGDIYDQHSSRDGIGFRTHSADVLMGMDTPLNRDVSIGVAGGYTYSSTHWNRSRGEGEIHSGSLATYLNWKKKTFFTTAMILGSYNSYKETRHIHFSSIDRRARGHTDGGQVLANLSGGGNFQAPSILITPFFSGQLLYTHMGSFHEKGANSIDLDVFATSYALFRGQGGLHLSHCSNFDNHKVNTAVGFSYIREQRFSGKRFTAAFDGNNTTFTVVGNHPSRNVFYPEVEISFLSKDEKVSVTIGYNAQVGNGYCDQAVMVQGRYAF